MCLQPPGAYWSRSGAGAGCLRVFLGVNGASGSGAGVRVCGWKLQGAIHFHLVAGVLTVELTVPSAGVQRLLALSMPRAATAERNDA